MIRTHVDRILSLTSHAPVILGRIRDRERHGDPGSVPAPLQDYCHEWQELSAAEPENEG